jgi:alkaline phosphatase
MKVCFLLLLLLTTCFVSAAQGEEFFPLHSHNDYLRQRPLHQALENNFGSVEADIWLRGRSIQVGHYPWQLKGGLEEMYLMPLQKMLDANAWPARATPLLLWLDLKDPRSMALEELARLLGRYPMIGREVRVIMTGIAMKRKFIKSYPHLLVEYDQRNFNQGTLRSRDFEWYALDWDKFFKWKGKGIMPQGEMIKLREMIGEIHGQNKKVRFYHTPYTPEVWQVLIMAGADLISSDRPEELNHYWRNFAGDVGHSVLSEGSDSQTGVHAEIGP